MSDQTLRFPATDIERFLASAFVALNVPEEDAAAVARLMVKADLYGYETHGTFRLRQYANRLRDGGTNPKANVRTVEERDSTALVDGDNGLGHLGMQRATDIAIEKAAAHGIGWAGLRNSNHAGPASLYVNMVVEHDMVGLYGAVGSANHVPPFGGMDLLLGTNPIAIAVPAGKSAPFVLDMATTVAAAGKIRSLAQRGEPMPEGWMVGRDGKPLTDPKRQSEGLMLPIGGAKGYGLAMALGLLAGTLNGAAFGKDVVDMTKNTATPTNTGQFVAAISVPPSPMSRHSRKRRTMFSRQFASPSRCRDTTFAFPAATGSPCLRIARPMVYLCTRNCLRPCRKSPGNCRFRN